MGVPVDDAGCASGSSGDSGNGPDARNGKPLELPDRISVVPYSDCSDDSDEDTNAVEVRVVCSRHRLAPSAGTPPFSPAPPLCRAGADGRETQRLAV